MTHDSWQTQVERATTAGHIGDLLLLADEAPNDALRGAVWLHAAQSLRAVGQNRFALELQQRVTALGVSVAPIAPSATHTHGHLIAPRQVLLFSGHMVDKPDRATPRFPASKVTAAAQRIAEVLAQLDAGPQDIALTQGACGGDLLFSESCLQRRVRLFWLQPFEEPRFLQSSVRSGGDDWQQRYQQARAALATPPRAAPVELGPPPLGKTHGYAYERCNRWLLYTALVHGADKLHFICLWNGADAEGAGGTGHMAAEVRRYHGRVTWIDTHSL